MKHLKNNKHKNVLLNICTARDGRASLAGVRGHIQRVWPLFFGLIFQISRRSTSRARVLNDVCSEEVVNQTQSSTSRARVLNAGFGLRRSKLSIQGQTQSSTSRARVLNAGFGFEYAQPSLQSGLTSRARVLILTIVMVLIGSLVFGFTNNSRVQAAPSDTLNFQGRLLGIDGGLVADGYYNIQFNLYTAASGGSSIWTENREYNSGSGSCTGPIDGNDCRVRVSNGYFSVYLGEVTALPNIDYSQQLYLTMNIDQNGTTSAGAITYDGEMNPRFKLTAVPYAFRAANVASGDTNAASTDSSDVSITTGDALGATSDSGDVTIDSGTATGTAGQVLLGTTNASGVLIGNAGATTTIQGSVSLTGAGTALTVTNDAQFNGDVTIGSDTSDSLTVEADATFNGSLTVSTGDVFQNAGATLFSATSISDRATGGNIGTAAATVDVATTFDVNQTTAGQTLTLPTPTNTASGRVVYVNNVGSANFTMYGETIETGSSSTFIWNGSTWTTSVSFSNTGVDTVGALDGVAAAANGATISGTTIYLQSASATAAGLVNTSAQTFAGTKTFNNGIVLAANQTLTVTGGTTANRPGSPTAGMVYYDTNTNTLLTYNGAKWIADRGEYIIVAANDSTQAEKDSADYVADNTDDHLTINSAIGALSSSGGKVLLLPGTFTVDGSIEITSNVTLAGSGQEATTLIAQAGALAAQYDVIENANPGSTDNNITIRDLTIDGNKDNVTGNDVEGILLDTVGSGSGATYVRGFLIENVTVTDTEGNGIDIDTSANGLINNVLVKNNGSASYGIRLTGSDYIRLENNDILNGGGSGVLAQNSDYLVITGNLIDNQNSEGLNLNAAVQQSVIDGNRITNNGSRGIQLDGPGAKQYNVISNNYIGNNTSYGLQAVNTYHNSVVGNLFYTNDSSGSGSHIDLGGSGANNSLVGNTIRESSSDGSISIEIGASQTNTYLADNLIDNVGAVSDSSTSTIYANQIDASDNLVLQASGTADVLINSDTVIDGRLTIGSGFNGCGVIPFGLCDEIYVQNNQTITDTAANIYAGNSTWLTLNPAASSSAELIGTDLGVVVNGSSDTDTLSGYVTKVLNASSGTLSSATGSEIIVATQGGSSGDISSARGLVVGVYNDGSGTIDNAASVIINNTEADNSTNLLIGTGTIPTGNFSIYNSSLLDNYFAGNLELNQNLEVNGNTTIGDAAGDTLTVNAGSIQFANNFTSCTVINTDASGNLGCDTSTYLTSATVSLQGAYDGGNTVTTTNARDILFTLADTTTDSDFIIDIASGSTSEFAIKGAGTNFFTATQTTSQEGQIAIKSNSDYAFAITNFPNQEVFTVDANYAQTLVSNNANTAGRPALSFAQDTDTGIYRIGADQIGVSTGGSLRVSVTDATTTVTNALTVTGLTTLNGGLTVEAGDNFTFNSDVFTDFTGGGLYNNSGVLSVSNTGASGFFQNGGNLFGTTATLGTNDLNPLVLRTNSTTALTIDTSQNITTTGNLDVAGRGAFGNTGGIGTNFNLLGILQVDAELSVEASITSVINDAYQAASANILSVNPASNPASSGNIIGGFDYAEVNAANTTNVSNLNLVGTAGFAVAQGSGDIGSVSGGSFSTTNLSTGTVGVLSGIEAVVTSGGSVSEAYGGNIILGNSGSGTISNARGLRIDVFNSGSSITNAAGIVVERVQGTNTTNLLLGTGTIPSGNYSIYNASTAANYFGGSLQVQGATTINNTLTVNAGTITNSGVGQSVSVTLGNDGDDDQVVAFQVNATSANTGDADDLVGIYIADVLSPSASVAESGLIIGSGWDHNIFLADASTNIGVADGGTIAFTDDVFNNLLTITDAGSVGNVGISGTLTVEGTTTVNDRLTVNAGTITNTGAAQTINFTLGDDADQDQVVGLLVQPTSFNSGDYDNLAAFYAGAITGYANTWEVAYAAAAGYDIDLAVTDTDAVFAVGDGGTYTFNGYNGSTFDSLLTITDAGSVGNVGITGTLQVDGLTTLNGGLTIQAGDTFTFNSDAFTDFTGGGLVNTGGVLSVDTTSAAGFFQNGGNSFSGTATLGTNDANSLVLETNNQSAVTIANGGAATFQNASNSTSAFRVRNSAGGNLFNVDTTNGGVEIGGATTQGNLKFSDGSSNFLTVNVGALAFDYTVSIPTISANDTFALLGRVQTFTGQNTFQNASNSTSAFRVNTSGGASLLNVDTTNSLVTVATPVFQTVTNTNCGVNCTITQSNVDNNSAIIVNATAEELEITLPDPTNATAGRVVYVTAANGSNDFTLLVNGGGQGNEIAMRANTTATMIWNGNDWTAAGASSSTTLQAAYDNTLTSAGGAEIVLSAAGGNADGLTVRNNATAPIIGGIFEAQTSIGSNLFSVNNNATEYATNGGAETDGAGASTFPASTWDATTGGTVDRYTTAGDNIATGQASVRVQTTSTNHGARNRINTALTPGLTYTVSFAIRATTSFSTLNVLYSPDGSTTGTTNCVTGQRVTSGQWTRVTCTFVAGGSISSSNSILIRQSDSTSRTFYIDNLSINVNASATFAADGSVDSALGSNWTAFGTLDALTRETSVIYDTSGSVAVDTPNAANRGVRNNLAITPEVNTQYLVSFYARSTNTFNDIRVRYSRNGGSNFVTCEDYNTQTVSTTGFTKITCLFTTDGTTASNPDLIIDQPTGSNRIFYIDALIVTLNTDTSNNVQIGGGNRGGPVTLFTLDRSAGAPIADNNEAYLGSMYYDTVTGRIQCYEADGWGACGAAPDNVVNLNPEYAGSVLNGSGVGTMTADFCSNGTDLTVNTSFCGTGEARNYYNWTSPQATEQTYSIYVTYQLPETFNGFSSDDTVQLVGRVDNTSNASVTYEMFHSTGSDVTQCGTGETNVITGGGGAADTWYSYGINGNESTGCALNASAAGDFIIFKINLKAQSNANAYVSTLSFVTTGR